MTLMWLISSYAIMSLEKHKHKIRNIENRKAQVINISGADSFFQSIKDKIEGLEGIDVKSASEFYDAYRTVFEKLPIFKNKFSAPGAHILGKSTYANSLWTYAGNADVTLNVHWFSSWEKISKTYAKDVADKFHPAGTSAKALFFHEIGHDIDCYCTEVLKLSHGKKTFSSYLKQKAIQNFKIKTGFDTITEELSEYASEDAKEFFAEAFAEYFDSNNTRRLASEVIKLFFEELSSVGG